MQALRCFVGAILVVAGLSWLTLVPSTAQEIPFTVTVANVSTVTFDKPSVSIADAKPGTLTKLDNAFTITAVRNMSGPWRIKTNSASDSFKRDGQATTLLSSALKWTTPTVTDPQGFSLSPAEVFTGNGETTGTPQTISLQFDCPTGVVPGEYRLDLHFFMEG